VAAAAAQREWEEVREKYALHTTVCADAERILALCDKDRLNGHLTTNELQTHLTGPGVAARFIEFREWILGAKAGLDPAGTPEAEHYAGRSGFRFKQADEDGSGSLTADELRRGLYAFYAKDKLQQIATALDAIKRMQLPAAQPPPEPAIPEPEPEPEHAAPTNFALALQPVPGAGGGARSPRAGLYETPADTSGLVTQSQLEAALAGYVTKQAFDAAQAEADMRCAELERALEAERGVRAGLGARLERLERGHEGLGARLSKVEVGQAGLDAALAKVAAEARRLERLLAAARAQLADVAATLEMFKVLEAELQTQVIAQVVGESAWVMRRADKHATNGLLTINELRTFLAGPAVPVFYQRFRDWLTETDADGGLAKSPWRAHSLRTEAAGGREDIGAAGRLSVEGLQRCLLAFHQGKEAASSTAQRNEARGGHAARARAAAAQRGEAQPGHKSPRAASPTSRLASPHAGVGCPPSPADEMMVRHHPEGAAEDEWAGLSHRQLQVGWLIGAATRARPATARRRYTLQKRLLRIILNMYPS
jgi:hypothetical protein